MQLILETEASVDLKTKMSSLTGNIEKAVSDVLTGVQNGDISNGDATTENNAAAEETDNNGVQKIDQINKPSPTDTDKDIAKNGDAKISENDIDTSNDCNTTDIPNGNNSSNKEAMENIEELAQPHAEKDIKYENTIIEENHIEYDSKSNETEANCDDAANPQNKDASESNIDAAEPVDTVCNNAETEARNIEASRDDGINKNSHPCPIENIKQESIENTESVTEESSNNIDSKINLHEELDIKEKDDESSISDDMNTEVCEDSLIKKEIEETSQENNLELNSISNKTTDVPAQGEADESHIKKEIEETSSQENNSELDSISHKTTNVPAQAESDDSDIKLSTITTKIPENTPASEEKETMETENAEDDASEENIDLIRSEASDTCDKMNDADITDEAEKEDLSTNNAEENDNLNTSDVTRMDIDVNITAGDNVKNEIDSITPVSATVITETNVDINLPTEQNVSQLDDNKNIDDIIVNLDDDKDKNTEPEKVETVSTLIKADDDEPILNRDDLTEVTDNLEKSPNEEQMSVDDIIDLDEPKESQDSKSSDEKSKNEKDNINNTASENDKPIEPILKLSNTLDILSDDEEEQALKKSNTDNSDNKCINIEDDDDIMLIDDDTSGNESKIEPTKEQELEKQIESKPASPTDSEKVTEDSKIIDKNDAVEKDAPVPDKEVIVSTTSPDISEKTEENKFEAEIKKPLIPENFLKTCKKNLVDMTRDELEEFCVLKIVESILDRSNLSEIKNKLKTLTQNLEEYKKKAMMLQKQNRDLQVVFKSVQDDVKKASDAPIVPLKITRSVGMQVLMSDKTDKRRRPGIGMPNNFVNNNKQVRNPVAQGPRPQKPPTQPIPVPRLVPASPAKNVPQQQVNPNKVTSPLPNGVKSVSPVQKGEKRTHNRMQSVTVDLTDDEPPTKMVNRTGPMPPVRLVPSQNLLAAPRTPSVNSPRKVYIPISGPQGQNVRPGQTIMLKTVPTPSGPRQRTPPSHMVRMPHGTMRMTRPQGLRHPAPLPECMKQYQPPNWKALPPAPDLKLAKVENGIVISWKIEGYQEDSYEEIASYQLYAYQETTSPPSTALWKKIGDVKALSLPMACTLTQFMAGYKYYFAVRAVDIRSRLGPFSLPGSILLLNKM